MATCSIPRLDITVKSNCVHEAVVQSIKDLGYEDPRQCQIDVVVKFVTGRDTFVSLPTGSGKSVCFACTPIVFDKLRRYGVSTPSRHHCISIVVSPLTALMADQVSKFRARGVKASYIGDIEEVELGGVLNGDAQLVYLSPESVLSHTIWREMIRTPCYQNNLVCLAVDEAHLIDKW